MQDLKKSFDAFFKGDDKVMVLKGGWGVGKTHFWNEYIAQRIKANDLKQIAYSYISFFGKTSLSDIRKSVFHSAEAINSGAEIKKLFEGKITNSKSLLNFVPWINQDVKNSHNIPDVEKFSNFKSLLNFVPWINKATKNARNIPAIEKFSNMISSFEYSLVDNYVICFDDLERKADTLAVKEIMGLIDELATHKNCKIILIFNENELGETLAKKEFDLYREKIVDIELNYKPTCVENMKHVFPDDSEHLSIIKNVVNELDIKNIRVLRKIHRMIEKFDILSNEHPNSLVDEFITHAAFFCWGYFVYRKDLSFETIKYQLSQKSWMDHMSDDKREKTLGEKQYSVIASNLKLFSSRLDTHIIHYLEQGVVDEEELKDTVSDMLKSVGVEKFRVKLINTWDMYIDSFEDNLADFIIALKNILKEDMDKIELLEFSLIINFLEEFGEESVLGYIEDYVERHKELLKNIDLGSWGAERIKNEDLKAKIYEIYQENKHFSIDDVAERIAEHQSYGLEDVDYLSSLDKEYFREWMKSNPKNLVNKIRKGLFIFRNSGGHPNQEKIDIINSNVRDALLVIAKESPLNKKRVKYIYDIE